MASKAASGLLTGKLALVTGGGSGIGQAVCHALAQEGCYVAVCDINEAAAQNTASALGGESHTSYAVDVGLSESVAGLMQAVLAKYKQPPSIVVNCAGILRHNIMVQMDEHSFDEVIRVNLKGTFLVTQIASQAMIQGGVKDCSIINISSIAAKTACIGHAHYAASKTGVVGFTKTVAKELAKYGIRCNAVLPGFIDTPMSASADFSEQQLEELLQGIPLSRKGKPEEVADLCVFLASNKSSYITGAAIEITGGLFM